NLHRLQPSLVGSPQEPPSWHKPNEDEILHVPTETAIVTARIRRHTHDLQRVLTEMGAAAGITEKVRSKTAAHALRTRGQHITNIVETTRADVMDKIASAYDEGLSIPNTATEIRSVMSESSIDRAVMIARTEMIGVVNTASLNLASQID